MAAGSLVAWAHRPREAYAARRDPRLLVVILRGALDGLSLVPPVGDRDYRSLRGDNALGLPEAGGTLRLDGFFALNDAMPKLHALYHEKQALFVHAAATPYRDRSHFDGQNVLESGLTGPGSTESGWLNRVAAALPSGETIRPAPGLAVGAMVPLILRGPAPTLTWEPPILHPTDDDTAARLLDLYAETDPALAAAFSQGLEIEALAGSAGVGPTRQGGIAEAFRAAASGPPG